MIGPAGRTHRKSNVDNSINTKNESYKRESQLLEDKEVATSEDEELTTLEAGYYYRVNPHTGHIIDLDGRRKYVPPHAEITFEDFYGRCTVNTRDAFETIGYFELTDYDGCNYSFRCKNIAKLPTQYFIYGTDEEDLPDASMNTMNLFGNSQNTSDNAEFSDSTNNQPLAALITELLAEQKKTNQLLEEMNRLLDNIYMGGH